VVVVVVVVVVAVEPRTQDLDGSLRSEPNRANLQ
jgi:hypothetical protein